METHSEPAGITEDDPPESAFPDHRRLIGQSFFIYTRVRTLVVITIILAALFARYVLRMQGLDAQGLVILAGGIALYNSAAWVFFRRFREPNESTNVYRRLLAVTASAVIMDFLALTVALWLVGGARSPFAAFYLLHIMVCCILLSRRAALTLTLIAYGLLVLLVTAEWAHLGVPHRPIGAIAGDGPLTDLYALTLIVVYGMLFALSAFLLLGLNRSLRRVERRILLANAELNRLSQLRKDFLHIATHNLRAPLGVVVMLLQNMRSGLAGEITDKQRDWLDRSLRRLDDLSDFMINMQTLSALETDIIQSQFSHVDLTEVVHRIVEQYQDVAEAHHHRMTLEVPGPAPSVLGHERLLREAIVNYITNAIKYTPDGGEIVVRVLDRSPVVRVEVTDNGIGVAPEDRNRLFQEFVRISNPTTEVGTVKGSGLGLSIVKRIALAHGGITGIESPPDGRGSTFYLELPALHD